DRRCREPYRQWFLQTGLFESTNGVCRGGTKAARREPGRECRVMLEIKNLHASVAGKEILRSINLTINAGEVHAIMGPNGSGKSTLAQVLAGREAYEVTQGEVRFEGKDLLEMDPEERAREGIFLAFQY